MDATLEYLWAAGYDLPPERPVQPKPDAPKRRGKKAAQAKRQKAAR